MREEWQRLLSCMRRAKKGEELTIGFMGGSITQGSLASGEQQTYAWKVYEWWCRSFPDAVFHYVNGGIGGTTSHFGVARAEKDLLMYQPDVVILDFNVNDKPDVFFQETYEGLLRKILFWPGYPAVLILNNVYYDTGVSAQDLHNELADYYHVPYVSVRDTIYHQMKQGIYTQEELTPDGLHPNDKGHGLIAEKITRYLEAVKEALEEEDTAEACEADRWSAWMASEDKTADAAESAPIIRKCKSVDVTESAPIIRKCKSADVTESAAENRRHPLTKNAYEDVRFLNITNAQPKLEGFRADAEEKKGHLDCFKNGWIGKKNGDRIIFEEECSCLAVQYRKTIQGPSPVAMVFLDGDTEHGILLDGNFEERWGDCLYLQPILHHEERRHHTIEIKIIRAYEKDKIPFYLLGLIVA